MDNRNCTYEWYAFVAIGIIACLSSIVFGLRNYENNSELAQAMRYDIEMNGGNSDLADRSKAEYHYLKYLEDTNDTFQQARVYCQLGSLYAVAFNQEKGEERDCNEARYYYQKVLEVEPERFGRATMVARSMLTELNHPEWMGRIKARMEYYQWLNSFDKGKIRENWLPSWKKTPERLAEVSGKGGWLLDQYNASDPNVPSDEELLGRLRAVDN